MKFTYAEMQTLNEHGLRLYKTPNGDYYPSITTVLGYTTSPEKKQALEQWQNSLGKEEADRRSKAAADYGTAVHLLIERFLKKEDLVKEGEYFSNEMLSGFNALKAYLKKINPWGQEVPLYSDELGVAGRTDAVGEYEGVACIIDFKTSGRIKNAQDVEDYNLQLAAYSIMHNEMFGTNIDSGKIIMTSAGGFPQIFNVDLNKYYDELRRRITSFYTSHPLLKEAA